MQVYIQYHKNLDNYVIGYAKSILSTNKIIKSIIYELDNLEKYDSFILKTYELRSYIFGRLTNDFVILSERPPSDILNYKCSLILYIDENGYISIHKNTHKVNISLSVKSYIRDVIINDILK